MNDILNAFFNEYLPNIKSLSHNTIKSYVYGINNFIIFLEEEKFVNKKINFSKVTLNDILKYKEYLSQKRNNTLSTINQRISCLKTFYSFLASKDDSYNKIYKQINSIIIKKSSNKIITFFSEEEIIALLNSCNKIKDRLIIQIIYETGARVSEFINIQLTDLEFSDEISYVTLRGKGGKVRKVPISKNLSNSISNYLNSALFIENDDNYLFFSNHKKPYSRQSINSILKRNIALAKEKNNTMFNGNYGPHALRHSIATILLNKGVSMEEIRVFLGHKTQDATKIYATVDLKNKNEFLQKNAEDISSKLKKVKYNKYDVHEQLKELLKNRD